MNTNAMKRVLVVDDDPIVSKCFEEVLKPKGYAVISASGGAEALEKIATEDYDAVYTDIKMPGLSGIEVARQIRASRPWLPVVIVTGYGSADNIKAAKDIGVTDFLQKPLSPEMIEGSATGLLEETPAAPAAKFENLGVAVATPAASGGVLRHARNVALFAVAPFIALAYVVVGPLVGLGALAWFGAKAIVKSARK